MTHLTEVQINEYLDEALNGAARRRVEAHLDGCPACRAQLAGLERTFDALAALPDAPLATDLSSAVVARLESEAALRQAPAVAAQDGAAVRPRWESMLLAIQALAAVALIVLFWPLLQTLAIDLAERVVVAWAVWLGEWEAMMAAVQAQWGMMVTAVQTVRPPASPNLSAGQLTGVLALALIIWLVGNGLLLRPGGKGRQQINGGNHA